MIFYQDYDYEVEQCNTRPELLYEEEHIKYLSENRVINW